MKRTERHIIVKSNVNYKNIDRLCFLSKNLYNYANYLIRQEFINNKKFIGYYELDKKLNRIDQVDYRVLPAVTSQQILMLIEKSWKSFFKSIKAWKTNPSKFNGRPKLPKYKNKTKGRNIIVFTGQQVKLKEDFICFPKKANLKSLKTKVDSVKQVRIIPQQSCYVIEVIYEKKVKQLENLDNNLYLGIDLGVNNLATLVSNSENLRPLLLSGRVLKSVNQYYNKKLSRLKSDLKVKHNKDWSNRLSKLAFKRNNIVNNYLHHTSRFVVNYCIENNINTIVIGKNKNWKQNVNIGKRNNQNFIQIPYNKLICQIQYKAEEVGISIVITEESYTSKCSALDQEKICRHKEYKGKRIKRGLFQSTKGLINADVNGALNILRKVINDSFIQKIIDTGLAFNPLKFNIL